jgi:hypothetical protein
MELDRSISKSAHTDTKFRYTVRLWGPMCDLEDEKSILIRFGLLQAVIDNPALIDCGGSRFDKLTVYYDQNKGRWTLEASAIA